MSIINNRDHLDVSLRDQALFLLKHIERLPTELNHSQIDKNIDNQIEMMKVEQDYKLDQNKILSGEQNNKSFNNQEELKEMIEAVEIRQINCDDTNNKVKADKIISLELNKSLRK